MKPWPFGADSLGSYFLASWIVIRDSSLTSFKSDLEWAGFLGRLLYIGGFPGGSVHVVGQNSILLYGLAIVHCVFCLSTSNIKAT